MQIGVQLHALLNAVQLQRDLDGLPWHCRRRKGHGHPLRRAVTELILERLGQPLVRAEGVLVPAVEAQGPIGPVLQWPAHVVVGPDVHGRQRIHGAPVVVVPRHVIGSHVPVLVHDVRGIAGVPVEVPLPHHRVEPPGDECADALVRGRRSGGQAEIVGRGVPEQRTLGDLTHVGCQGIAVPKHLPEGIEGQEPPSGRLKHAEVVGEVVEHVPGVRIGFQGEVLLLRAGVGLVAGSGRPGRVGVTEDPVADPLPDVAEELVPPGLRRLAT